MAPNVLVLQTVAEFKRRLEAAFGPALLDVRLFGSHARGEANEESDVDVFVLLRTSSWDDRRRLLDIAADLSLETDLPISPTVFDAERFEKWRRHERALVMDIERDGIRP